jgi:hypothetical protein
VSVLMHLLLCLAREQSFQGRFCHRFHVSQLAWTVSICRYDFINQVFIHNSSKVKNKHKKIIDPSCRVIHHPLPR